MKGDDDKCNVTQQVKTVTKKITEFEASPCWLRKSGVVELSQSSLQFS